jgi:hypothetical protein
MVLTRNQREALKLLANSAQGFAVPALVRGGCTAKELHRLVRGGLVRAERIRVLGKAPSPADFHVRISDAGRQALARHDEVAGRGAVKLVLIVLFVLGLLVGVVVGTFTVTHS